MAGNATTSCTTLTPGRIWTCSTRGSWRSARTGSTLPRPARGAARYPRPAVRPTCARWTVTGWGYPSSSPTSTASAPACPQGGPGCGCTTGAPGSTSFPATPTSGSRDGGRCTPCRHHLDRREPAGARPGYQRWPSAAPTAGPGGRPPAPCRPRTGHRPGSSPLDHPGHQRRRIRRRGREPDGLRGDRRPTSSRARDQHQPLLGTRLGPDLRNLHVT